MAKQPINNGADPSQNILNALLKGNADDHFNFVEGPKTEVVTSGSLTLDGLVTVETGSVVRLVGPTESGKTSQAFLYCKHFLEKLPTSKALYIKAEARLGKEMQRRSGLKFVFKAEEWEDGTVFVLESNVFEFIAQLIEVQLRTLKDQGKQLCVIIDSLDGLILRADLQDKQIGESPKVAGVPALTKMFFKRLGLPISKYGSLVFLCSQVSSNIKLDPYSKEAPRLIGGAGGNSANHQSDYILEYQPRYNGDFILEDEKAKPDVSKNKILGHWAKIKIIKSAKETSGNTVTIPIKYGRVGNAVWQEKEIVDFLLANELVTRKGAWFSVNDVIVNQIKELTGKTIEVQYQGVNSLYEYFEVNKDVTAALFKFYSP